MGDHWSVASVTGLVRWVGVAALLKGLFHTLSSVLIFMLRSSIRQNMNYIIKK
jgi:hypothetical protein